MKNSRSLCEKAYDEGESRSGRRVQLLLPQMLRITSSAEATLIGTERPDFHTPRPRLDSVRHDHPGLIGGFGGLLNSV